MSAVWEDGTPRSQGNAFTWHPAPPAPVVSERTLCRREQAAMRREISAAYRLTEKGRAVKAKYKAKLKGAL